MNIRIHKQRYIKQKINADLGQLLLTYQPASAKHRRNYGKRFTIGLFGFPVRHELPTIARMPKIKIKREISNVHDLVKLS
jgi:hypothetical protein